MRWKRRQNNMIDYRVGYEYYKEACEKYDLEPVNFHYFILNLSHEQLTVYNDRALQKRGHYEFTI